MRNRSSTRELWLTGHPYLNTKLPIDQAQVLRDGWPGNLAPDEREALREYYRRTYRVWSPLMWYPVGMIILAAVTLGATKILGAW